MAVKWALGYKVGRFTVSKADTGSTNTGKSIPARISMAAFMAYLCSLGISGSGSGLVRLPNGCKRLLVVPEGGKETELETSISF